MNELDYESIKDFCEKALEIADQYGVEEGLSFLIGEKFFKVLQELKETENKSKFLIQMEENENHGLELDRTRNFNFAEINAQNQNYGAYMEKIKKLKKIIHLFVIQIKETFETSDIEDYLVSYPSLGRKELSVSDLGSDSNLISFKGTLAEIRDIFYIEEIKQIFLGFEKDKAL